METHVASMSSGEPAHRAGPRHTFALADLDASDAARAGGKARGLAALISAGFRVPAGFVIAADAFERFCAANRLAPEPSEAEVLVGALPDELAAELIEQAATLGAPLAVRSS